MNFSNEDGNQSVGWALHFAGAAFVALVITGYYYFVYQGLALRQENDASRIDQLSLLLSESAAVQHENHKLQLELNALAAVVAEIRNRLPYDLRQEEFTADLSRVAEATGLRLEELHWTNPAVTPNYAQAQIDVDCSGSFDSICRFLDDVSQLARITDVAQLKMESNEDSPIHSLKVSFVLYYDVDPRESDKNEGVL
jgi:Tfp pilus assembly protein PilO